MSRRFLIFIFLLTLSASGQTPVNKLWTDLQQKRIGLAGIHQLFDVTVEYHAPGGDEASKQSMVVDMSPQGLWREETLSGAGNRIRIFDGTDTFVIEGEDEFVRVKPDPKSPPPVPCPYCIAEADWSKAKEVSRQPCGFSSNDHTCIILQVPLKARVRIDSTTHGQFQTEGVAAIVLDTETGVLVRTEFQENVRNLSVTTGPRSAQMAGYQRVTTYALKHFDIGAPVDANLFKLPSNVHEVNQFARRDLAQIKKELVGKEAPQLSASDMNGKKISLTAFKGKTVLLDFWASWCPPCREDSSSLEKLNKKYGGKELAIIGISVDEDRKAVEKFLKKSPTSYAIALTTENQMPRPYQISEFPTYIVIDQDGNVTAVIQGDKGFLELKNLLQKAGMSL